MPSLWTCTQDTIMCTRCTDRTECLPAEKCVVVMWTCKAKAASTYCMLCWILPVEESDTFVHTERERGREIKRRKRTVYSSMMKQWRRDHLCSYKKCWKWLDHNETEVGRIGPWWVATVKVINGKHSLNELEIMRTKWQNRFPVDY